MDAMKRNLAIILMLLSCVFMFISCGKSYNEEEMIPEEQKLIIYTAHKEEIYKPIIREFEERSGIRVDVYAGGTNQMLERIASKNGRESADVMFGGGADSLQAYGKYFEPYVTSQDDRLDHTYASPDHVYTVFSKLPIVFVYNTKLVLQSGAPRSWEQLIEYSWNGGIAFTDPVKSGSAYTALSMLVQELGRKGYGQEEAIRSFAKVIDGDLSDGSNTVVEDVASGNKMIGITLEENALKKMAAGADIEMIYPREATCAVPDGCAIIRGAKHRENAEKFMEFIVGDDVQQLLADQLFRRSVRMDIPSSEIPDEVPYDIDFSNANREEILRLWEETLQADDWRGDGT